MASEQWTTVPWTSLADEPFTVFIDTLKTLVTTPGGIIRSESGRTAVVATLDALRSIRDVQIFLDQSTPGTTSVAWLLIDTDRSSLTEELRSLSTVGDLLVIPTTLSTGLPEDFSTRGQIIQHVDQALFDTFDVLEHRATAFELLSRDAPIGLGEDPDNLTGRADWFKKRH